MKKAMAELDAQQREALLYVVDLCLAICASALTVGFLKVVVDIL
jgi:hypothetical protein